MISSIDLKQELTKAQKLLNAHPHVNRIEMILPDTNARLRGKWLPVSTLETIYTKGVRLAGSVFALDMWGAEVNASGMITHNGDPDAVCFPVVDGLQICHWSDPATAQLMVAMYDMDGSPFFADPRHIVKKLMDKLASLELHPVVALEMEFHLFDKNQPVSRLAEDAHSNVYSLDELHQHQALFSEIERHCQSQSIPSDTIITEAGSKQFEINLHHVQDACLACEHAVLLKHIIKSVAEKHEMTASFMAKPVAQDAGNGMHVNISLVDRQGNNVFCDSAPGGSELMQAAIAGLLATMQDSTLLFAPHANSYRRFQPDSHAPTALCWGMDNRNMAIRLPANPGNAMRIEHRVAGADANPYLVVASILAGILHGIENQLRPPKPETGIPDTQVIPTLPKHWDHALNLFNQSTILRHYLDDKFCDLYVHCKQQEIETINKHISDIEYSHYLLQC